MLWGMAVWEGVLWGMAVWEGLLWGTAVWGCALGYGGVGRVCSGVRRGKWDLLTECKEQERTSGI